MALIEYINQFVCIGLSILKADFIQPEEMVELMSQILKHL